MYPVIELPQDAADLPEQLGTKFKFWARLDTGEQVLFKQGRPETGENWAEVAAAALAALIGIPHARYDLAIWSGRQGVVSYNICRPGSRLVHGNEVLARVRSTYNPQMAYRQSSHTVRLVCTVMGRPLIGIPSGADVTGFTGAVDVFVGYLLFDAWIGNQDRHHENWGLVVDRDGVTLAPSYDHASSLGRNETDEARRKRLTTRDNRRSIAHYVTRARSALYGAQSDKRPLGTLEAFEHAANFAPVGARYWLQQLSALSDTDVRAVFDLFPPGWISEPAREFAIAMLTENRQRLLRLLETLP